MFLKFKKSKLHTDEEIYKKIRNQLQKLIKKKQKFYQINLEQKINNPKEFWKILKSMGLPSKAASASNICLKVRNEIVFNDTKNCSIFKSVFSNLAQNLVSELPPSPNVITESKIISYYDNIKFNDNLSGKFLKDGASITA